MIGLAGVVRCQPWGSGVSSLKAFGVSLGVSGVSALGILGRQSWGF